MGGGWAVRWVGGQWDGLVGHDKNNYKDIILE